MQTQQERMNAAIDLDNGWPSHRRAVDLIRGPVFEALVPAPQVVEVEVGPKLPASLGNALVSLQVDLLVLDAPPEALDEDVDAPIFVKWLPQTGQVPLARAA